MNVKKQRLILFLITSTILTTIVVQFYWNYNNYQQNKQHVLNEIQLSLDNAIETYYTNLSKENFFTIIEPNYPTEIDKLEREKIFKNIFKGTGFDKNKKDKTKSKFNLKITSLEYREDKIDMIVDADSLKNRPQFTQFSKDGKSGIHFSSPDKITKVQVFKGKKSADSLKLIKGLQTMIIAIHNDNINYVEVDSILDKELKNKGINSRFFFNHLKQDSIFFSSEIKDNTNGFLVIEAKSTFLKPDENFVMHYSNPTKEALKRSLAGIFLSLLLSLAIIFSLFYLLHIIKQQKELALIKNDLISNITHEFKTPITTASTALEAIQNFQIIDNKEKTKKYIATSAKQLNKLHLMVEKLLETATLDSNQLLLQKEHINMVDLITEIVKKYQFISSDKTISFSSTIDNLQVSVDAFHFENAISNLVDNAIKYGGNNIKIYLKSNLNNIEISVTDDGNGIDKNHQEKIFEQFYRIPKGNTHDVKGFGIGLYYSKKIIEKHGGKISVSSNPKTTIFKILLPNE